MTIGEHTNTSSHHNCRETKLFLGIV